MARSLAKRVWYDTLRIFCRIGSVCVFRVRCYGREHIPPDGGVLVLSNHQSHLDPILIGIAIDRRLNFLARQSLFRFAPFRWLIQSLDTIPIDREGSGLGGLKETLRRLKNEEMVVIFPEGTRTRDGEVAELKNGFLPLARRSQVPMLVVGIDGAYEAWPRTQRLPRPAVISIAFGRPIDPQEIAILDDQQVLNLVRSRLRHCHLQARAHRELSLGRSVPAETA